MGVASELAVKFTADTSGLEAGGQKAEGLIGRMTSGLGKLGLAGMGVGAITGAVSGVVGSFGDLIGAAEASGDAMARLNGILGEDRASMVAADAAEAANGLGMTKTAYLEAAGAAADYLTSLGLTDQAAASMSVRMTELAPQLAAFANADPTQVMDALQKGVGGSTKGLKDLGIAINDDLLKGLDDASKSAEIFRQIQEQSEPATAAWADNQGDVANSMARVSAAMDDAKAAIGDRLLPAIAPLAQWFADTIPGAIDTLMQAGGALIDSIKAIYDRFVSFFTDTQGKGESFRDQVMDVWSKIRTAVSAVVDWFNANVKPILVGVFSVIAAKVAELKAQFDQHFGGIRGAVQAVVDWFNTNVAPTLSKVFGDVMAVIGPVVAFIRDHMDQIKAIVGGALDVVIGAVKVAFNLLKGVFEVVMAAIRGDWGGAWEAIKKTVANIVPGIKQVIGGMFDYLKGLGGIALDALLKVGENLIEGLKSGARSAWESFLGWFQGIIDLLPATVKKILGIHSPSTVFAGIGENVVEGLKAGMSGLAELSGIINETLGRIIGDADRENFKSIAELTGSLLDIFTNTTKAIRALLDFDITTSAAQISAQFDALVGTFQTALLRMKGLAQNAGGSKLDDTLLNFFDVQNIEIVSKGFDATIGLINGVLDIAAKLETVKVPNAADIEALFEPLEKLGNVAARFIDKVGKPQGEDATAYFQNGANTTAALASWAKSIADIVGIKFGAVSAEFASQMEAAAGAAADAWAAVKDTALAWGQIQSTVREQLITGIQAYATAVGAAVGLLKATAELKIDVATLATADQMKLAAEASKNAVAKVAEVAKDWLGGAKWIENAVAGIKAYAEAAGAAVSLLKAAADLDLSKMVAATDDQLHKAADVSLKALGELGRVAAAFVSMGAEARTALVQAVKDYAEAAGAAVGLLGGAAALDFTKAVAVNGQQLHDAADATLAALGELQRVAAGFVTMGHEATGPLVQSIKDFAEGAGAAVDLLVKGAQGMNALGEIKRLSGIQPRLIRTILKQLRDVVDIVTDPKNAPKTPTEAQLAALKSLGDSSGVFDGIVKAAAGMNELGQVKRLSGVQPRLIRTVLSQLSTVIGIVTDPKTALKPITSEQAAAIKAIGDSSGVLSSLSNVADGFAKMSGKLSIPTDLSARVTTLIDAMRTVVNGIAGAMTGDNAINLKDAVAGADIAEAVGRIGDAFGPIFDAINAAIESPFGRIKATGQRGDTFRQNIANRIKASLVSAVTALSEALGSMPTITIPDGLSEQIDKLAGIYDRILDVIGKLDGVKIDTRAVASLAAALGVLAGGVGGVGGVGAGGISVTGGGSQLSVASGPGGGIVINNEFNPTLTPLPITINTTNNITVGGKVVDAIAVEVKHLQELELRQGGTP